MLLGVLDIKKTDNILSNETVYNYLKMLTFLCVKVILIGQEVYHVFLINALLTYTQSDRLALFFDANSKLLSK